MVWHYVWIVYFAVDSHEMLSLGFTKKYRKMKLKKCLLQFASIFCYYFLKKVMLDISRESRARKTIKMLSLILSEN